MLFEVVVGRIAARIGARHGYFARRRFEEKAGLVYVVVMLSIVPVGIGIAILVHLIRWWLGYPDLSEVYR